MLWDNANQESFTVTSATGQDASAILSGSGSTFSPVVDPTTNQAKIIFTATIPGGAKNLINYSFMVKGGVTITMEIYGVNGFKYSWNQVCNFWNICLKKQLWDAEKALTNLHVFRQC